MATGLALAESRLVPLSYLSWSPTGEVVGNSFTYDLPRGSGGVAGRRFQQQSPESVDSSPSRRHSQSPAFTTAPAADFPLEPRHIVLHARPVLNSKPMLIHFFAVSIFPIFTGTAARFHADVANHLASSIGYSPSLSPTMIRYACLYISIIESSSGPPFCAVTPPFGNPEKGKQERMRGRHSAQRKLLHGSAVGPARHLARSEANVSARKISRRQIFSPVGAVGRPCHLAWSRGRRLCTCI
ncbi:Na(+)/H(+) antiporter NhaA [Striga asiatica]|uniref:Na(+)/H(+) antiporter NhaA n=1 Tax=Striga asiatica TaxID=4170 RepID=A0A5A7RB82_STRAF|nr:Na(+)/H(+) antiporter NhaA [Striga asiatica]